MPTYVVVVSESLVVSSIKIDKSTMSWAITFDAVDVDVDQLQTSAIAHCYRRTTHIFLFSTLDRPILLSVLGLGPGLRRSRLLRLGSLVGGLTLRLLGSCR